MSSITFLQACIVMIYSGIKAFMKEFDCKESWSTIFATDEWSRLRMPNLFDVYTMFA